MKVIFLNSKQVDNNIERCWFSLRIPYQVSPLVLCNQLSGKAMEIMMGIFFQVFQDGLCVMEKIFEGS